MLKSNKFIKENNSSKLVKSLLYIIPFITIGIEWLCSWPAKLTTDSYTQLMQIAMNIYTDVHPAAHTLFCKLLMQIVNSPAIVIFFQILFISIITGYIFNYLYKKGVSATLLIPIIIIWSCLGPIKTVTCYFWKDIFFAIGVLLLTVTMIKILDKEEKVKWIDIILAGIALAVVALFRHNGIVIFIFSALVLAVIGIKENKKILVSILIPLLLIIGVKIGVYNYFNVLPNDNGTKYALPAKAIVSVVYYDGNYTNEELEKIEQLLPADLIKDNYNLKDGKTFLWYNLKSENGFEGNFQTSLVGKERIIIELFFSLYPKNIYIMTKDIFGSASLMIEFQKNLIDNNMVYMLILVVCIIVLIQHKKYRALLPFIPCFANILSILISNVSFETRYAYPTIVCTAVLLVYTYTRIHIKNK